MAEDYPDGTLPVGIKANYIGNLPVNITAQTIATLSIDIITMPNVTIGTWAAGTLTIQGSVAVTTMPSVTIGVWSAGTLVVSGSVVVTSIPTVTIGTWSAGTLVISGSVVVTSIPTVTIGVWSAGTLTIDGSVIVSSMPAVTIGTWNAGTLNVATAVGVALTVTVGTWNAGTLNVAIASSVALTVTIGTWNAGTLTVNINTMPSVTIGTWSAGTLTVIVSTMPNITIGTWSAGTLNVAITSAVSITIGTWSAGTLSIDITAATIGALNIKTSGGINIVLDKLTVDAYTERRSTLSNDNGGAFRAPLYAGYIWAKFFPRGCRGFLDSISVVCSDVGVAGGTIIVTVSPYVGGGAVYSANITVPAEGAKAARTATFNKMWNYDSMFVMVYSSNAELGVWYDTSVPYDWFQSLDSGVTWASAPNRGCFTVTLTGETCGDVPVSGTVNNIEIPTVSSADIDTYTTGNISAETTIASINGAGKLGFLNIRVAAATNSHMIRIRLYCDSNLSFQYNFIEISATGFVSSTPGISLLLYTANGECSIMITLPFSFKRSFVVTVDGVDATTQYVWTDGFCNLIT